MAGAAGGGVPVPDTTVGVAHGCTGFDPAGTGEPVGLPGLALSVLACWVASWSGDSVGGSDCNVACAERPPVWPVEPVEDVWAHGVGDGVPCVPFTVAFGGVAFVFVLLQLEVNSSTNVPKINRTLYII